MLQGVAVAKKSQTFSSVRKGKNKKQNKTRRKMKQNKAKQSKIKKSKNKTIPTHSPSKMASLAKNKPFAPK